MAELQQPELTDTRRDPKTTGRLAGKESGTHSRDSVASRSTGRTSLLEERLWEEVTYLRTNDVSIGGSEVGNALWRSPGIRVS